MSNQPGPIVEKHWYICLPFVSRRNEWGIGKPTDCELFNSFGGAFVSLHEYVEQIKDTEKPILMIDYSQNFWILSQRFIILTDMNIPCQQPVYLTICKTEKIASYTSIIPPVNKNQLTLDLGFKRSRDVMVCFCENIKRQCYLCQCIFKGDRIEPPKQGKICPKCKIDPKFERAKLIQIGNRIYRKLSDIPLKYVSVNHIRPCTVCGDNIAYIAKPDTFLLNEKLHIKAYDKPLMYMQVYTAVHSEQMCRSLVAKGADMFVLSMRTARVQRVTYVAPKFGRALQDCIDSLDRDETRETNPPKSLDLIRKFKYMVYLRQPTL